MSSNQTQQPGLVAGHAQYIKGAAEVRTKPQCHTFLFSFPIKYQIHMICVVYQLVWIYSQFPPGNNRQRNRQPSMEILRRTRQRASSRCHEKCKWAERSEQGSWERRADGGESGWVWGDAEGGGSVEEAVIYRSNVMKSEIIWNWCWMILTNGECLCIWMGVKGVKWRFPKGSWNEEIAVLIDRLAWLHAFARRFPIIDVEFQSVRRTSDWEVRDQFITLRFTLD